jgi:hypothetical protein
VKVGWVFVPDKPAEFVLPYAIVHAIIASGRALYYTTCKFKNLPEQSGTPK